MSRLQSRDQKLKYSELIEERLEKCNERIKTELKYKELFSRDDFKEFIKEEIGKRRKEYHKNRLRMNLVLEEKRLADIGLQAKEQEATEIYYLPQTIIQDAEKARAEITEITQQENKND